MTFQLTDRERRWIDALLILGTVAVGFIVAGFVSGLFFYFGDIVLIFFLAWLLAFILSPVVGGIVKLAPRLPRVAAVVVVYAVLLGALSVLVLLIAQALATSISDHQEYAFARSVVASCKAGRSRAPKERILPGGSLKTSCHMQWSSGSHPRPRNSATERESIAG